MSAKQGNSLQRTYKGLKPIKNREKNIEAIGLQRTYKGLKPYMSMVK